MKTFLLIPPLEPVIERLRSCVDPKYTLAQFGTVDSHYEDTDYTLIAIDDSTQESMVFKANDIVTVDNGVIRRITYLPR